MLIFDKEKTKKIVEKLGEIPLSDWKLRTKSSNNERDSYATSFNEINIILLVRHIAWRPILIIDGLEILDKTEDSWIDELASKIENYNEKIKAKLFAGTEKEQSSKFDEIFNKITQCE